MEGMKERDSIVNGNERGKTEKNIYITEKYIRKKENIRKKTQLTSR